MRILLLNDYSTPMGGAEGQVMGLRELLRAAGHDARVFSSTASTVAGAPAADYTCWGTMADRLNVLSRTANLDAVRRLRRALVEYRPDVVHVRMFLWQLSPLILPLLREVPAVYHVAAYRPICPRGTKLFPDGRRCDEPAGRACLRHHCVTPQTWVMDMAQLRLWRRWRDAFDAVLSLSEAAKVRLEAAGVGPITVVPNAVAPRPIRPPLTSPPTVAFAGRLVPEKGCDLLLRAFAQVDRPDRRLLIAGHGPARGELERLAEELGISRRVEFLGHLSRDELERRFDRAWVQVVPGRWEEPFGNVATEGMMRGTAMVVSDLGGPAEVVEDGRTGVVVPPDDPAPLAAALDRLLADPLQVESLGRAAHETAVREYSESRLIERLEAVYERIIDEVGAPA